MKEGVRVLRECVFVSERKIEDGEEGMQVGEEARVN